MLISAWCMSAGVDYGGSQHRSEHVAKNAPGSMLSICLLFHFFPPFFWWLHRAENASYPSRDLCTSWDGCENPAWQCPLGNISGHREEVMISTRTRSSGTEPDSMNKGTSRPSFKTKSDYKKIAIQGKSWFAGSSISLLCTDTSVTMVKWWCILLE